MGATTVADATAAVEGFNKRYEAKFGTGASADSQRKVEPILARVLVLANRKRLTNTKLAAVIDDDDGFRQLVHEAADSTDEEERNAASSLQSWLEPRDVYTNAERNIILAGASLMVRQDLILG
jgi:hypothetical protein